MPGKKSFNFVCLFNHCYSLISLLILPSFKDNILDIPSFGITPLRLANVTKEVASKLALVLPLVYSPQERQILIQIFISTSLNVIVAIAKSISLNPRTGLQPYLYISFSEF